ncbi:DUF7848 domain-containing protein [Streptomyces scabiei]|uniref:DUF7848 domain-containing protein n=1 Tax=Streptomyces scabiei TaxID=1930 RepID=UPI0029B3B81F|nr:hypothetical protein [Streptomyces scabiei]MDX3206101.1 hypothetical protein [Streptomyces scabiei]
MLKFVSYVTRRDPEGELVWKAVCASGDEEAACKAASEACTNDEAANDWMLQHTAKTGHRRFQRIFEDYAVVEPKS